MVGQQRGKSLVELGSRLTELYLTKAIRQKISQLDCLPRYSLAQLSICLDEVTQRQGKRLGSTSEDQWEAAWLTGSRFVEEDRWCFVQLGRQSFVRIESLGDLTVIQSLGVKVGGRWWRKSCASHRPDRMSAIACVVDCLLLAEAANHHISYCQYLVNWTSPWDSVLPGLAAEVLSA